MSDIRGLDHCKLDVVLLLFRPQLCPKSVLSHTRERGTFYTGRHAVGRDYFRTSCNVTHQETYQFLRTAGM
jgi:hypothetical protein